MKERSGKFALCDKKDLGDNFQSGIYTRSKATMKTLE